MSALIGYGPLTGIKSAGNRKFSILSSDERCKPPEADTPQHLSAGDSAARALVLPRLATANDIREVVQYLKQRPGGVNIHDVVQPIKKRVFYPAKIAAYELWGLVARTGDHLALAPLGWEFAKHLEPESQAYRALLWRTPCYRDALERINGESLSVVIRNDLGRYWRPSILEDPTDSQEKDFEGSVVSFFHLCQAAELGTMTIGKRGHPARLRVWRDALLRFLEDWRFSPDSIDPVSNELPVFISHFQMDDLIGQVQTALEINGLGSAALERIHGIGKPVADSVISAMSRARVAIIVVSERDYCVDRLGTPALKESILSEIGAAFALLGRRFMLLCNEKGPLPGNVEGLPRSMFNGRALSCEAEVALIKTVTHLAKSFG